MIYVLDGYNVIHRVPDLKRHLGRGLEAAREGLIRFCREWIATRGDVRQFWIVFDGRGPSGGEAAQGGPGIRVMYSADGETADDRIISLMEEVGRYSAYTVISDDNMVVDKSRVFQAETMSVMQFYNTLRAKQRPSRVGRGGDGSDKTGLSPGEKKAINDSLKRAWGIEE